MLTIADLSIHAADISYAASDPSTGDRFLEAAKSVIDTVWAGVDSAGRWLMNSRPATFIAGVVSGALALPAYPVEGFEDWFYYGEALGAVVGLFGDAGAIVAGWTLGTGGAGLTVTTGGLLAPAGAAAVAGGAVLASAGASSAGVHFNKLRDALDYVYASKKPGGGGGVYTLQSGGRTMKSSTARELNKISGKNRVPREWGRALEELKFDNQLPRNHHGKIMSNGDYVDRLGNVVGNLLDY